MKFMMMVKNGKNPGPPPKELMDAIFILSQEAVKDGTMISTCPVAAALRYCKAPRSSTPIACLLSFVGSVVSLIVFSLLWLDYSSFVSGNLCRSRQR